jgi:hypothetical protein
MKLWITFLVFAALVAGAGPALAGGARVFIGIGPVWGPPIAYPYPYVYPAPPVIYPAPPVIIQQPPPIVVETPPLPAPHYWYYCDDPRGYYPHVPQCPLGWVQVVPGRRHHQHEDDD